MAGTSEHGKAFIRPQRKAHLLVIEARFHDGLSDALLDGATSALKEAGATWDVVTVPGSLEIPAVISFALDGAAAGGTAYDGFVALGTVIRGDTYHFDIVANESSRALMDLSVQEAVCVGNGILTTENDAQAWVRARRDEGDKGGFAARAALTMIALKEKLGAGA
jgi:6,7-dimethyl-8-ribityllumazine synthase